MLNSRVVRSPGKSLFLIPPLLLTLATSAFGQEVCRVRPLDSGGDPGSGGNPGGSSGVIFESDFSNDSGYRVQSTTLWNGGGSGRGTIAPPSGWDGVLTTQNSALSVVSGVGFDGGNALKLEYDPNASQPVVSLAKHLTGDENEGYDELFVRYRVKFPNGFKVGRNGSGLDYWKWGRLWQNTSVTNSGPNLWTENRANSGFVVWNFANNHPYTNSRQAWAHPGGPNLSRGSAGGAIQYTDYFVSGDWDPELSKGAFERFWDINLDSRPGTLQNNTSQTWHTIEYRFKLASSVGAANGVFEMWFDGVPQGQPTRVLASAGAPSSSGIPTTRLGSGWNFLVVFDNLSGWNADWGQPGVDGYILVDDVVVSGSYIGPNYVVR